MALKKSIRDEKGQALILVVILLLVGTLIITPLLSFMGTGLKAGRVYEERMEEVYAADAGVEDAIWQIITKAAGLPQTEDDPPMPPYSIADVNGKQVNPVIITYIDETTYRINSTATSTDGSSTTIESYVNVLSFTDFMNNAITSMSTIDLKPGSMVSGGDVVYCTGDPPSEEQVVDGEVINECAEGLPTAEQLHNYYWPDVSDPLLEYLDDTIDVKDTDIIGPLYRVGDLTIKTTNAGESAHLGGTVYVTGDLEFQQTGKTYSIYLDGQTLYCEGEIRFPSGQSNLYGPGCIIALGDVTFQPNLSSNEDDFIFVMSVTGTVQFQPQGDFYGSLAGNVDVTLQPNSSLFWNGPPPTLKYPGSDPSEKNVIQAIRTWEIGLTQ